jgi:phage terminase Nu1 subunit (DNA packaging protein)
MIDINEKATGTAIARLTGLSESRVSKMKGMNVWSAVMTLQEANHSVIKWLGKRAAGHISEQGLDLVQERAALARENRETAALKNAELRGDLVRVDEIRRAIFTASRGIRNSLQTIPDRVSLPITGMTDVHEIHQLIDDEIHQVLSNMNENLAINKHKVNPITTEYQQG